MKLEGGGESGRGGLWLRGVNDEREEESTRYTSAHRVEKSSRSMTSAATRFFGSHLMWGDGLRPKSNHP